LFSISYYYLMEPRPIDEVFAENQQIMNRGVTTGTPHNDQMRRLTSNMTESVVSVHGEVAALTAEVVKLKKITDSYSKSSEKFARASRTIAVSALVVAVISLIVSVALGIATNNSDKSGQQAQLKVLNAINTDLKR
jgi:hypothetical protein